MHVADLTCNRCGSHDFITVCKRCEKDYANAVKDDILEIAAEAAIMCGIDNDIIRTSVQADIIRNAILNAKKEDFAP